MKVSYSCSLKKEMVGFDLISLTQPSPELSQHAVRGRHVDSTLAAFCLVGAEPDGVAP